MRSETVLAALFVLLGTAAPVAAAPEPSEAERIAALQPTGPARNCLIHRNILETVPVDGSTILVREGASRWYRNRMAEGCGVLRTNRIISYRNPMGSLCQGDVIDIVDPVSRILHGTCVLGAFEPIPYGRRAERE